MAPRRAKAKAFPRDATGHRATWTHPLQAWASSVVFPSAVRGWPAGFQSPAVLFPVCSPSTLRMYGASWQGQGPALRSLTLSFLSLRSSLIHWPLWVKL